MLLALRTTTECMRTTVEQWIITTDGAYTTAVDTQAQLPMALHNINITSVGMNIIYIKIEIIIGSNTVGRT